MNNTENNEKKKIGRLEEILNLHPISIIMGCIIIYFSYAVSSSTKDSPLFLEYIDLYNVKKTFLKLVEMIKNDPYPND
tara:strand:- start:90 stop:323 length:234 start_codon:yes stop_codon:yes gene_type:complete